MMASKVLTLQYGQLGMPTGPSVNQLSMGPPWEWPPKPLIASFEKYTQWEGKKMIMPRYVHLLTSISGNRCLVHLCIIWYNSFDTFRQPFFKSLKVCIHNRSYHTIYYVVMLRFLLVLGVFISKAGLIVCEVEDYLQSEYQTKTFLMVICPMPLAQIPNALTKSCPALSLLSCIHLTLNVKCKIKSCDVNIRIMSWLSTR